MTDFMAYSDVFDAVVEERACKKELKQVQSVFLGEHTENLGKCYKLSSEIAI